MFSISNYEMRNIKTPPRHQIPPCRMDILTGLQTVNAGERQQMMEPHHVMAGNRQTQKPPRKHSLSIREKKNNHHLSRNLSLGSDIPTPELISRESHHSERHVTPTFTAAPPSGPEPESQEHFNWQTEASGKYGTIYNGDYSARKRHHGSDAVVPLVDTRTILGGPHTKCVMAVRERKREGSDTPCRKTLRLYRGSDLNKLNPLEFKHNQAFL